MHIGGTTLLTPTQQNKNISKSFCEGYKYNNSDISVCDCLTLSALIYKQKIITNNDLVYMS